jgi:hypothetical protein
MTPDPSSIPGQLDVYDCLEIAETDGHGSRAETETDRKTTPSQPKPLTAAEVVARRLAERTDR